MNDIEATNKADEFIGLLIANQPGLFGTAPLQNTANALQVAQAIAALRQALMNELKQQDR